jgi:thiol-disulfide isomerase/thioredoxin
MRTACLALAGLGFVAPLAAQGPGIGNAAPVVSVHDLDGKAVDLGQWIGKRPVFLEFWATWCTSCQALEPAVRAAREAYGQQVEFVGINITVADPRDSVRAWVARNAPPWRTLYDDEGESQRAYDVAETSYVLIIDKTGTIVYTGVGGAQSFGAALRRVTTQ